MNCIFFITPAFDHPKTRLLDSTITSLQLSEEGSLCVQKPGIN
jgi:hypothetical protein